MGASYYEPFCELVHCFLRADRPWVPKGVTMGEGHPNQGF